MNILCDRPAGLRIKKGVPLALTVETPYSGALDRGYSKEDMLDFGAFVARAM